MGYAQRLRLASVLTRGDSSVREAASGDERHAVLGPLQRARRSPPPVSDGATDLECTAERRLRTVPTRRRPDPRGGDRRQRWRHANDDASSARRADCALLPRRDGVDGDARGLLLRKCIITPDRPGERPLRRALCAEATRDDDGQRLDEGDVHQGLSATTPTLHDTRASRSGDAPP